MFVSDLVTAIDQDSELTAIKMILEYVFDEANFDAVVLLMDTCGTIKAEKDAMVNADVLRVSPPTVEAGLVGFNRK